MWITGKGAPDSVLGMREIHREVQRERDLEADHMGLPQISPPTGGKWRAVESLDLCHSLRREEGAMLTKTLKGLLIKVDEVS